MQLSPKQYAHGLYLAVSEVGDAGADTVIESLIKLLKKNGHLAFYEDIIAEFEKLDMEAKGEAKANVTLAQKHSLEREILEDLNTVVGKKLIIEKSENPEMIGGIVVRSDDTLLDASLKEKLHKLQNSMIN